MGTAAAIIGLLGSAWDVVSKVLAAFGVIKSPAKAADPAELGEKVGKLEEENEGLKNYVDVADRASDARGRVVDDPRVVFDDPDNRRDAPASPPAPGGDGR